MGGGGGGDWEKPGHFVVVTSHDKQRQHRSRKKINMGVLTTIYPFRKKKLGKEGWFRLTSSDGAAHQKLSERTEGGRI